MFKETSSCMSPLFFSEKVSFADLITPHLFLAFVSLFLGIAFVPAAYAHNQGRQMLNFVPKYPSKPIN